MPDGTPRGDASGARRRPLDRATTAGPGGDGQGGPGTDGRVGRDAPDALVERAGLPRLDGDWGPSGLGPALADRRRDGGGFECRIPAAEVHGPAAFHPVTHLDDHSSVSFSSAWSGWSVPAANFAYGVPGLSRSA